MTFTSLYIHIPFCLHRCGYCDFNTYAGLQGLIPEYIQAVCKEIEYISTHAPNPIIIHTIYFGGGTPSLVPSDGIKGVLTTIKNCFKCQPAPEITLEANPGTVSQSYFEALRASGVNRISLGMQSAHPDELTLLGRQHSYVDTVKAFAWARAAGITNLNLDLIFGLPGQSVQSWLTSLEAALSLQPEHLSLYALTLEHGTPLMHEVEAGALPQPDSDLSADMYEAACQSLMEAGFTHYEISNWACKNGNHGSYECQHNLQYWRTMPYLGIGAGAHGFINHNRTVNVSTPNAYIKRMHLNAVKANKVSGFPLSPAAIQAQFIDQETEIGEMMMMGLRLLEQGVSSDEFQQRYGISLREKFNPQIERLISLDLLEWHGTQPGRLRLTQRGYLLGNQVFSEFI